MNKKTVSNFLTVTGITFFAIGLVAFPVEVTEAAHSAMTVCAKSVIPSLFPFFVISKLLIGLNYIDLLEHPFSRIMRPLFGLSGNSASALLLGLSGGYPLGAATCVSLYKSNSCTKPETERLLSFCNNSGPAFIIGAVGAGLYSSRKLGIVLFLIHISAAVSTGIILNIFSPISVSKTKKDKTNHCIKRSFPTVFTESVSSSLASCLSISAYIVFFSVVVSMLNFLNILPIASSFLSRVLRIDKTLIASFISGIFEVTSGTYSLASYENVRYSFILTSFLLGWGGFSVHFQTLGITEGTGLRTSQYFRGKLLHGVISGIYAFLLSPLISKNAIPTIATSIKTQTTHTMHFFMFLFCVTVIYEICKKRWKIEKK